MTISVAKDVEDFLKAQVRDGVCADANDLVNDVLRAVRDQQSAHLPVSAELEAWLLEAADSPTTPVTKEDFAAIRERARQRLTNASK